MDTAGAPPQQQIQTATALDSMPSPEAPAGCMACGESKETFRVCYGYVDDVPCVWCKDCLVYYMQQAVEGMYPADCKRCGDALDFQSQIFQKLLPAKLLEELVVRGDEMRAWKKTYCYKRSCNALVPPEAVTDNRALCTKCKAVTCVRCKEMFHFGPCQSTTAELERQGDVKRCPRCEVLIEKAGGCDHVYCSCGLEFCYGCLAEDCRCSDEHE